MSATVTITAPPGTPRPTVTVDPDQPGSLTVALGDPGRTGRPWPMVVGLTAQVSDYASHAAAFAGARFCRVFSKPGEAILPWSHPKYARLPRSWAPHGSFKDWPGDAGAARMVAAHLDAMPPHLLDGPPLLPELKGSSYVLTYLHEGENNGIAARVYRHRYRVLYDVVRSHRHGARVIVVPVQALQWTMADSTAATHKGDGDLFEWWAGVGDYAGIDAYFDSWRPAPDPDAWVALLQRLAVGTGRPLYVAELGIDLDSDPGHLQRPAQIRAVTDRLRAGGCAAVAWWCAPGENGRDFHLADKLSGDAWRRVIADSQTELGRR